MRRILSFTLALLFTASLPMTALAVTADTSYGDVSIGDTYVDHFNEQGAQQDAHEGAVEIVHGSGDASGTVSVDMTSGAVTVTGDFTGNVHAGGTAEVIVKGDVTTDGDAVCAEGDATVTVDGNINAGDDGVVAFDNAEVTVNGSIEAGDDGISAEGDAAVTVNGSIEADDDGISAEDDAAVTVNGSIEADDDGISAEGDAAVTVNGSIKAGDYGISADDSAKVTVLPASEDNSPIIVEGRYTGIAAGGEAQVFVDGDVTGSDGNPDDVDFGNPSDYSDGGYGIYANENSQVTITGDVTGGDAYGTYGYGGYGVYASADSEVQVGGNVTGGSVTADPSTAAEEQCESHGAEGVYLDLRATVTVGGNVTGGKTNGDAGYGGVGICVGVTSMPETWTPGSVTVVGNVSGGSGATNGTDGPDIYVFSLYDTENILLRDVPAITVGDYSSIEVTLPGIAPEDVISRIEVTKAPQPVIREESAPESYSRGVIWQNGYLQRALFKVENGAGIKAKWTEKREDSVLTIISEQETLEIKTGREGFLYLQNLGIKTLVIKTASYQAEVEIEDLLAINGTEYILKQEGEHITLTVDGEAVKI